MTDHTDPKINVRARNTDPETSHLAAAQVEEDQEGLKRQVATVVNIMKHIDRPLSDFELAELWPLWWPGSFSESMPRKARHFAREAGLVKHDGFGDHDGHLVRLYSLGKDAEVIKAVNCPCCGRSTKARNVILKIRAWESAHAEQKGLF